MSASSNMHLRALFFILTGLYDIGVPPIQKPLSKYDYLNNHIILTDNMIRLGSLDRGN